MFAFSARYDGSFPDAVGLVTRALESEGFEVHSTIEEDTELRSRLGLTARPYKILGACSPREAHGAVDADLELRTLLPCNPVSLDGQPADPATCRLRWPCPCCGCNVIIRQEDDTSVTVGFTALGTVPGIDSPALNGLSAGVNRRLKRVHAVVGAGQLP